MLVRRITSPEDFRSLQNTWDKVLHSCPHKSVFLTFEWFLSWWNNLAECHSLEVLAFFDPDDQPFGIAPLLKKGDTLAFMASQEVTDYCDFIFTEDKEKDFFLELLHFIRGTLPEIKRLELINIRDSSPTLSVFPSLVSEFGFSYTLSESDVTPVVKLPPSYEDYLSRLDRKKRHELLRKLRRLQALPDVRVDKIMRPEDLEPKVDIFTKLHQASSLSKAEFWHKPGMTAFFKEMTYRLAERGWCELDILVSGEDVIGALLKFRFLDEVHLYNIAYDHSYRRFSPGHYLFHDAIRLAIEQEMKKVDFLRGGEKYKYDFGAQDSKIWNLICHLGEHQT